MNVIVFISCMCLLLSGINAQQDCSECASCTSANCLSFCKANCPVLITSDCKQCNNCNTLSCYQYCAKTCPNTWAHQNSNVASCNQCSSCTTANCAQTCATSCQQPLCQQSCSSRCSSQSCVDTCASKCTASPVIPSNPITPSVHTDIDNKANVTTSLDITNELHNTNHVNASVSSNSTNVNNISVFLSGSPRTSTNDRIVQGPPYPVPVPISQPPRVVLHPVPVPVPRPYFITRNQVVQVPRPYPVSRPVPVLVQQRVPVPYPVAQPYQVQVPVPQPIPYPVQQPVYVEKQVPVNQYIPIRSTPDCFASSCGVQTNVGSGGCAGGFLGGDCASGYYDNSAIYGSSSYGQYGGLQANLNQGCQICLRCGNYGYNPPICSRLKTCSTTCKVVLRPFISCNNC